MPISSAFLYSRVLNSFLSLTGILISLYSVFIEVKKGLDKNYVAFCDIDDLFACSKVFSSKFGKGFGLVAPYLGEDHVLNQPNAVYGTLLYAALLVLSQVKRNWAAKLQLGLVILANCATPYLAYLLYKVIKAVCVLCVAIYIVNALLLGVALWRVSALGPVGKRRRNGYRKKSSKKDQ
ncbi:vitamin K epoxide reductase complex subunit 1 [Hyalella azteca]|uniref:vitamin-K-epoxide reductase (warfarin-sensitive) n=1 Tax=Hyalella azteca TaxID=294128 RepID=A0A8B7P313_HYAAZ|nr:vitamin K epoxide reductase complex subunit 1 [Hyalella azteca]